MREHHSDSYILQVMPTQALLSLRRKDTSPKERLAVATAQLYGDVAVIGSAQGRDWFKAIHEFGVKIFDVLGVSVIMGYVWPSHVKGYETVPGFRVDQRWRGQVGSEELVWIEVRRDG